MPEDRVCTDIDDHKYALVMYLFSTLMRALKSVEALVSQREQGGDGEKKGWLVPPDCVRVMPDELPIRYLFPFALSLQVVPSPVQSSRASKAATAVNVFRRMLILGCDEKDHMYRIEAPKKTDNKFTTLAPKISAKVLADIRNRTKNFTDLLAIITPDELDALQHAKLTEEEYELLQKRTNGAFTTADPGPPETSATTVKVTEKSSRRTTSRRGQISKGNETFPPGVKYDINAIIAIIANLTYDYEWNLTEEFNRTLIEHGVPTCPTASTLSTTPTTPAAYDFSNTSIVGKCFVCGLRTPEIPRSAACADAFSGDFLPLAPIDARARGQIATFRKYCRHLDVHNYVENPSEPRSIYGRFTGGCGVRWTDLTGVYTQRTCRARFRPMMGLHFASKRMAKLELALINVENGCIVSPMASLLAMSRGVSLYARFHACVCSGNWCNRAPRPLPLSALPPALALLATRAWILR